MQKNQHGESPSHISSVPWMPDVSGQRQAREMSVICHFAEKQHHEEERVKRKRGPTKSVCPYNKAPALQQMRDEILGTAQDIEQLLKLGRETHACPYYSTRQAIPPAQVILPPNPPMHFDSFIL